MFVDEAVIHVRGGHGGRGCVAFRREPYVPHGGPDGGNGGRGGDVIFIADPSVQTLLDFQYRPHYHAGNGAHGSGKNKTGRDGETLQVRVPCGTLVADASTGLLLVDLRDDGSEFLAARGGLGGRGNKAFATATNRAPRESEPGLPGEERDLKLQLKLIADIGLVGLPNAGKSTLLSVISAARPKIADYPFTTLVPYLGIVGLAGERRFVVADIPGLIEGSHRGHGLGDRFLRHVERTRAILYVLDAAATDGVPPLDAYRVLRKELEAYGEGLADRPRLVVANKLDLPGAAEAAEGLRSELDCPVYGISAVRHEGLREMLEGAWRLLRPAKE